MEFQTWMYDTYIETALYDYEAGPSYDIGFDALGRPLFPELTPAPFSL